MTNDCNKTWVKILNLFFGGVGTILYPFIEGKYEIKNIFIGVIFGLFQILHLVNILSVIFGFKFIGNFYEILGGENILKPFMDDKYKIFLNMTEEISENFPEDIDDFIINPKEILELKTRVTIIKVILLIISGFSYLNTSIIPLFKSDEVNLKILTHGIINPSGGMFISGILFFNNNDLKCFIISSIGVLVGLLLMFCPFILGVGLYLMKIFKTLSNLILFKMTTICIGLTGTFFNLVFNFLQKDLDKNNQNTNIFDIEVKIDNEPFTMKSDFGYTSVLRIIFNIILPGSGIFSLLPKYGWTVGIFFTGIVIFFSGIEFLALIIIVLFRLLKMDDDDEIVCGFLYTSALLIHIAGIIIIIISDYFKVKPEGYSGSAIFVLIFLNLISGGLGNLIIIDNFNNCCCGNGFGNCIAVNFKILWSIIGIFLQFMMLFFIFFGINGRDIGAITIIFVIFGIYIILSLIFHCKGKRDKKN